MNVNVKFEMSFEAFWDMYDKKAGRHRCLARWRLLTKKDILMIAEHVPKYVESTPDKAYRKHPLTYLAGHCWHDEIIRIIPKWEKPQSFAKTIRPTAPDAEGYAQIQRAYAKQKAQAQFQRDNKQLEKGDADILHYLGLGYNAYKVATITGAPIGRVRTLKTKS